TMIGVPWSMIAPAGQNQRFYIDVPMTASGARSASGSPGPISTSPSGGAHAFRAGPRPNVRGRARQVQPRRNAGTGVATNDLDGDGAISQTISLSFQGVSGSVRTSNT